ncbi:hypothetical protein Nepgr_022372 [Nepenthes gracilis]|uniref:Uncharacterized protein n=1 Tax=Nepenthes gracilis TaxID=150966 RepID=A0AAD3T0P7_NEPGR|nr:hypothetical protein Nepgr_022372 [Nepenthes gracilis]
MPVHPVQGKKRAASVAPSSSSSGPNHLSAGGFAGVGATSGIEVDLALETYAARLSARASGGVVLAQPAPSALTQDPSIEALGPQEPSVGSPTVGMLTEQQEPILEPPTVPKELARMEDTPEDPMAEFLDEVVVSPVDVDPTPYSLPLSPDLVAKVLRQRDMVISDRDMEIARPDSKLEL